MFHVQISQLFMCPHRHCSKTQDSHEKIAQTLYSAYSLFFKSHESLVWLKQNHVWNPINGKSLLLNHFWKMSVTEANFFPPLKSHDFLWSQLIRRKGIFKKRDGECSTFQRTLDGAPGGGKEETKWLQPQPRLWIGFEWRMRSVILEGGFLQSKRNRGLWR